MWANVVETGASETQEANHTQSVHSVRITMRGYPTLTMRHRIIIDAEPYEITGIQNTGKKQFTEINAIRRDKA